MTWWKLVPAWCWWGLALLAAAGVQQVRVGWAQGETAQARADLSDYRLEVAERDRRAAAQARTEEQRRQKAVYEVDKDAQGELEAARADADRAGDALQRLQQRYAEAERRNRACGDSLTAQLGQAAEAGARVRADLLGRLGEAVRFYAAEADRRGVAGRACEKAYEGVRSGGN